MALWLLAMGAHRHLQDVYRAWTHASGGAFDRGLRTGSALVGGALAVAVVVHLVRARRWGTLALVGLAAVGIGALSVMGATGGELLHAAEYGGIAAVFGGWPGALFAAVAGLVNETVEWARVGSFDGGDALINALGAVLAAVLPRRRPG